MIDRRALRAYWQSLPPETRVGWARSLRQCPLARYLRQRMEPPHSLLVLLTRRHAPEWTFRFMRQIDLVGGPISAQRALTVLTLIETILELKGEN